MESTDLCHIPLLKLFQLLIVDKGHVHEHRKTELLGNEFNQMLVQGETEIADLEILQS